MRRTERVAAELPVQWKRGGHTIQCTALDINAHGMFLSTDVIVEHGSLMRLEVDIGACVLQMFVTARYVGRTMRGQGIGAELFLIDEASRMRWMSFYESQAALAQQAAAAIAGSAPAANDTAATATRAAVSATG